MPNSLNSRIFALTALIVILVLTAALSVTSIIGDRIASETVEQSLSQSQAQQQAFSDQRLMQLELASQLIASDPAFVSYVAQAAGDSRLPGQAADLGSIRDLLVERATDFGFDFSMALDEQGALIVSSDQTINVARDLSDQPLVAQTLRSLIPTSGYWVRDNQLYHAAMVPLARGRALIGFLVNGLAINDEMAAEIAANTGTEIAILLQSGGEMRVIGSSVDVSDASLDLSLLRDDASTVLATGETITEEGVEIGQVTYAARLAPLTDANNNTYAVLVALASSDIAAAPFRAIRNAVLIAGLIIFLLACAAGWWLARRVVGPVNKLAGMAEQASQGEYQQTLDAVGSKELRRLSIAFNAMVTELRQKEGRDALLEDLSRSSARDHTREIGGRMRWLSTQADGQTMAGTMVAIRLADKTAANTTGGSATLQARLARVQAVLGRNTGKVFNQTGTWAWAAFTQSRHAEKAIKAAAESILTMREEAERSGTEVDVRAVICSGPLDAERVQGWDYSTYTGVSPIWDDLLALLPSAQVNSLLVAPQTRELLMPDAAAALPLDDESSPVVVPIDALADTVKVLSRVDAEVTGKRDLREDQGPAILPGAVLQNRYEIIDMLGVGGTGIVFRARDRDLGEDVALKMLRSSVTSAKKHLERMKQELRLARRISHPNVVRLYDIGKIGERHYISMELVNGHTLKRAIRTAGRIRYLPALEMARQICDGLAAAHKVGIVHRDLKPENLVLTATGRPKLMDFGIAEPITQNLTKGQTAHFEGTPSYLSPEQIQGFPADERADIYALGVVFTELFTGNLPHTGSDTLEVCLSHLNDPPEKPSKYWPDIPPALEAIILRCLEKDPKDRFDTVTQLRDALDDLSLGLDG